MAYHDETITRGELGKGYRAKTAQEIFAHYSTINSVEFWRRGGSDKPQAPRPGIAVYVMSSGGKWGRSKSLRISEQDKAALRQAHQAEQKDRLLAPFRESRELLDLLRPGCFRLWVHDVYGVMIQETAHDLGAGFGFSNDVSNPEDAIAKIKTLMPGHNEIYHPKAE